MDTTKQISNALVELKLNRGAKRFLNSLYIWSLNRSLTAKQWAAFNKIVAKSSTKIRCEDAPCCGCCE